MTRYEPYCDCLGGHVSMVPDPNGRWCRADDPRAVADDPSGIVQQMPDGGDDALKPCPFCGCDNVVILYDHPESVGPSIGGGFYISHPLWRDYPQSWGCQAVPSNGYFQTEQEAIAAWNRRATEADLRAEVERFRAALIKINVGNGWAALIARAALFPKTDGGQYD